MSNTAGGWLFIAVTAIALWMLWRFLNFVADILEIYFDHYRAVSKRGASSPDKEKESSSSSWQRFSS